MAGKTGLYAQLASGVAQVCRAWAIRRRDGAELGFTDHDRDLSFDGIAFRAGGGMTARAFQQTTGLSVDNSEAVGVLSDSGVTEADILAGRYDGAEVRVWLVNWADVSERVMLFRGTLGEITRGAGAFRAELRGLAEGLNQPQGRVYHRDCAASLGDAACGFDLGTPGYAVEAAVDRVEGAQLFRFDGLGGFAPGWRPPIAGSPMW